MRNVVFSALLALLPVAGCSHTRPDEMSAESHRAEASLAEETAARERSQYDPHVAVVEPYPAAMHATLNAPAGILRTYNPTDGHLEAARRHEREAKEHLYAARELERFEDAACSGVSATARAGCPFVTPSVATVEEVSGGVRLHLRADANGRVLATLMQCHLAFARTRGYPKGTECPLYFKGVSVDLVDRGAVIEIRGDDAATAAEVRRDAATLFAPSHSVRVGLR